MESSGVAAASSTDIPSTMSLGQVMVQSSRVLLSRARLFASLALTLTLPLCFIVLAHNLATDPIASRISRNRDLANSTSASPAYTSHLHRLIRNDRIRLAVLLAAYILFVLVLALLSTAAIVYTVACIFTKRNLTYRKVITVIPKLWKRLLITFMWAFLIVFCLVGAFIPIAIFIALVFVPINFTLAFVLWWIISILFFGLLFHFTCIFNLANVISVLEESYGLKALKKSNHIIKGKRMDAYILSAMYLIFSTVVVGAFDFASSSSSPVVRVILAIVFAVGLACVDLAGIVVFTILYFACKAYHHEPIDSLALSEHLGAYTGEYVNLRAAVQMEAMQQA